MKNKRIKFNVAVVNSVCIFMPIFAEVNKNLQGENPKSFKISRNKIS